MLFDSDIQKFTFTVESFERSTDALSGTFYKLVTVPRFMFIRYELRQNTSFYARKCYDALFELFKTNFVGTEDSNMLFTGVPGIGKSMFSLYLLIRLLLDDSCPRNGILFEYERGKYNKVTLIEKPEQDLDSISQSTTFKFKLQLEEIDNTRQIDETTSLILSDIAAKSEPGARCRCNCIFSSPNPDRYKEIMKVSPKYTYTMPTWSYEELRLVDGNVDNWMDHYLQAGGVPRTVFANKNDYTAKTVQRAIYEEGWTVMKNLLRNELCDYVDTNFALIHINPPFNADKGDYDYRHCRVFSFASKYVLMALDQKYHDSFVSKVEMALDPKYHDRFVTNLFTTGLAK